MTAATTRSSLCLNMVHSRPCHPGGGFAQFCPLLDRSCDSRPRGVEITRGGANDPGPNPDVWLTAPDAAAGAPRRRPSPAADGRFPTLTAGRSRTLGGVGNEPVCPYRPRRGTRHHDPRRRRTRHGDPRDRGILRIRLGRHPRRRPRLRARAALRRLRDRVDLGLPHQPGGHDRPLGHQEDRRQGRAVLHRRPDRRRVSSARSSSTSSPAASTASAPRPPASRRTATAHTRPAASRSGPRSSWRSSSPRCSSS